VATIGELKASEFEDAERYDCSYGARIRQYPFLESATGCFASLPKRARLRSTTRRSAGIPTRRWRGSSSSSGWTPPGATRDFRSVEQHILGNAMRLGSSSEITLDERWRASIELTTFERIAGRLNRAHGYVD
jgi:hypothetical protein